MIGRVEYLPRPEVVTADYMLQVLREYYDRKWNSNADTVKTVSMWKQFPLMIRMPDIKGDFGLVIDEGKVVSVTPGAPREPQMLVVMLAETMQRIYYDETTSAIETIAGRIKFRGNEREKRRLLAAVSFLTW